MELAIFDLDGTLIDSKLDIVNSVNATREHFAMPPLSHDTISSYVGNGAPVLIQRAMGPNAPESALEFFLAYYHDHMLDSTELYPGVHSALDRMQTAGIHLAVLTNKPVAISQSILEALNVSNHFKYIYGGNSFSQKKPHPIGIDTLVSQLNAGRALTIMVGDSGVDIDTARAANVQACGVTYGFAPETFKTSPPDFLVDNLEQLADRVIP